jgi:predicted nucleic acid-binding protein
MVYIDTSIFVGALTAEPRTREIQNWLAGHAADETTTSDWTLTEFSSALAKKARIGDITAIQRKAVRAAFRKHIEKTVTILPVSRKAYRLAADFVDRSRMALRAPDALHLAVAAERGITLCTLDRRLAEAGAALGADTLFLRNLQ